MPPLSTRPARLYGTDEILKFQCLQDVTRENIKFQIIMDQTSMYTYNAAQWF